MEQLFVLCAIILLLMLFVRRNQDKVFSISFFISIVSSSLIFDQKYTLFDEVLVGAICLVISYYFLKRLISREARFPSKIVIFNSFFTTVFLVYLFLNSFISFIKYREISSLRFCLISFCITTLYFYTKNNKTKLNLVSTNRAIYIYTFSWLSYYFILKFLDLDWTTQQSVSWAGSSYAAIPVVIGLYILYLNLKQANDKNSHNFIIYIALSASLAILYDSRILLIAIIVFFTIYISQNIKQPALLFKSLIVVLFFSTTSLFIRFESNSEVKNYLVDTPVGLSDSAQLITNTRESDMDRKTQINCAQELIFRNESAVRYIFGYGQNQHKRVLLSCYTLKGFTVSDSKIVRPVGYSAFLVDYGVLGLLLLTFSITNNLKSFYTNKVRLEFFVLYITIILWSLVTNYLDNILIYFVLFLDLGLQYSRGIPNKQHNAN
jgi:hypothetical protein